MSFNTLLTLFLFFYWYRYLKESPSGEFINVVNADGCVVAPVLAQADLEPSVQQELLDSTLMDILWQTLNIGLHIIMDVEL